VKQATASAPASSAATEPTTASISAARFAALAASAPDSRRAATTPSASDHADTDDSEELLPQPTDPDQMKAVAATPREPVRAPQLPATDATTPSHAINPGAAPASAIIADQTTPAQPNASTAAAATQPNGVAAANNAMFANGASATAATLPNGEAAPNGTSATTASGTAAVTQPNGASAAGVTQQNSASGTAAANQPNGAGRALQAVGALSGELALLAQAQRALHDGKLSLALTLLDQHGAEHAQGSLLEERLAARAVVLCRMHQLKAGNFEAQRLAAQTPRSPLLPWVRSACKR
jgi:hypothetical protein